MPWNPPAASPGATAGSGTGATRIPPWFDRMEGRRPRGSRWFPVVLAAVIQLPGLLIAVAAARYGAVPLVAVVLAFLSSGLLAFTRRWPGAVLVAVAVLCAPAVALSVGPPFAAAPMAIAVVGAVARGVRAWAWWTLAGFAVVAPSIAFMVTVSPLSVIRPLIVALVLLLLVGVGEAIRNRAERYRDLSRQLAARREAAAEAERLRIARELHDVLAHSLSQISVQAGVGLHLFDTRPDKARESLEAIKTTSGQALEEVRGVLGFLRSGATGEDGYASRAPEPDLARIPLLVDTYRRAGLDVTYRTDLAGTPTAAAQLALYRIVQESLTNAGRHAHATTVDIRLSQTPGDAHDAGEYVLTVTDDGRGLPADGPSGGGRGLLGMRERAELLGGSFVTRPADGGGLVVEARLPVREAAP